MENANPAVDTAPKSEPQTVVPTSQEKNDITLAQNIISYLNNKTGDKSVSEKLQDKIDEYTVALKIVYKLSKQVIALAKDEQGEDNFIETASQQLVNDIVKLDQ